MIGPVESGSAINQPLIECPQRRPARLAVPINTGVTINLSSSRFMRAGRCFPIWAVRSSGSPSSS